MPRRKKEASKEIVRVDACCEVESMCGSKSNRSRRSSNKRDLKRLNKTECSSAYFATSNETSVVTVKETHKRKKCEEAKGVKSSCELPTNEENDSDTGMSETHKRKKRKEPKGVKSSSEPLTNEENDSDNGMSEYFSPNQKKKKGMNTEIQNPSLAAKIKANMSCDEDSDFENNSIQAANEIDKISNRKNKQSSDRKNNAASGDKRNSVEKYQKKIKADAASPPRKPKRPSRKCVRIEEQKDIDQDNVKPSRKRKSNDLKTDVIKSRKIRGKAGAGDALATNVSREENFDKESAVSNDGKDKSSFNVNRSVKNNAVNRKNSDDVNLVLKTETGNSSEEKPCVEMVTSKNNSEDSSDDDKMDVEEDCPNIEPVSAISDVTKPLPKAIDQTDALAILMHMEGVQPGSSTSEPGVSQTLTDDDQDDSEDEEWEDVEDHHGSSPSKSQIPQGTVEVKFDAPEIYKKRKKGGFDLQAYFRRQTNKFKREVAMDIHKVHLLCLLARCQYLNRLCQDETVQAQALSIALVTKELKISQTKSCTEQHLNQVLAWIRTNRQYLLEIMEHSLQAVSVDTRIILICVILLRQVGFMTRLMMSLQPIPFRNTVTKAAALKKGKSAQNEKAKSTKRKSSSKKDNKASVKKLTADIKEEKDTVKLELDKDNVKSEHNSNKRKGGSRKCSKVSKNAYKIDEDNDSESVGDKTNDSDFKPEDEELEKKAKKHGRRGSRGLKEEKGITVKEEQISDEDFEEDSIVKRSKQLRKLSSSPQNRKVLSEDDDDCIKSGVDYWIEVYLKKEQRWISIDGISVEMKKTYEIENTASQPVCYIVGIKQGDFIKDVTARYASQWLTETRKLRVEGEWWAETLKPYLSTDSKLDEKEDMELNMQLQQRPLPTSIGAFKSHPLYALRRHLLKFEALYPDTAIPVGYIRGEPVYARECVHTLHSRENWLKEGRAVRLGEEAYKFVKSRPKWNRPKEDPEAKDLEIFGQWQTEVYIPPPAVDGVVPRNAHGNVEMYQPSMLPAGTVHLKVSGLNKVAKKLDIDCAPAMVGWEQHCGFSHPLMDGWIVCEGHKDILLAAWDEEQEIIREKEQQKREKRVYENWRKLIRGMLIKERLKKRFDLEDKPKDCVNQKTHADDMKSDSVNVKADDVEHSWPQNRLKQGNHTLCDVESL